MAPPAMSKAPRETSPAPASDPISSSEFTPRVAPLDTVTAAELPIALLLVTFRRPSVMSTLPLKVLTPARVSVPLPDLVKPPDPPTAPPSVVKLPTVSVRVEERGVHDGRTRLARLLLQAADTQASRDEDHVELRQHVPQAVLGATLGLGRQTVNRLLQELQSEALVEIGRARLTVRSRAGLRRIAHPPREAD